MNCTLLPEGYRQIGGVDLMQDRRAMRIVNLCALIITVILLPLGLLFRPFLLFSGSILMILFQFFRLCAGIFLYMVLHELVHGVLMRYFSGLRPHYGFNGIYAFAGSESFFDRKSYLIISLAPVVLLGAVLMLLCFWAPNSLFWLFYLIQVLNLSGAAGDFYVSLLLRKQPSDLLIQDSGVAMKFYSAKNAGL